MKKVFYIKLFATFDKQLNDNKMASLASAIKKGEKLSGAKIQTNANNQHWFRYKGYDISFYPNQGFDGTMEATCFSTGKGTFFDNLSQAVKFVDQRTK